MKPPILRGSSLLKSWPGVILIAAVPFLLTGLISMPRQASNEAWQKDGLVDIDVLIQKVTRLNQQKRHQESIELLTAALENQHEDSVLRPLLLQTFDMFLEDQVRSGEQEILSNNKDTKAYLRVASSLELMDNKSRAMEILVNGVSISPDANNLWMEIGKLELKAGRDMEALDVFKEVIKSSPGNSNAYNNAAFILARSSTSSEKDLKDAQEYAQRANKLEPKNPEYIDTLAEIFFREGNSAMAQSLIKEAIKLAPNKDMYKNQLKRFSEGMASPF